MFAFHVTTDAMYVVQIQIHTGIALDVSHIMCIGVDVEVVDGALGLLVDFRLWEDDTV